MPLPHGTTSNVILVLPDLNHFKVQVITKYIMGVNIYHFSYTLYTDSYDHVINNSFVL